MCPSRSSSVRRNSGLPSGPGDAQHRRPAPALAEVDARDVAVRLKTHGPRRIGWVELEDETLTEIKVLSRFDLDLAGQMTVASDRSRGAAHPIQPALDGVTGPPPGPSGGGKLTHPAFHPTGVENHRPDITQWNPLPYLDLGGFLPHPTA